MKISVVIPCYRSKETIEQVVEEIKTTLKEYQHEIILVNDCSPDSTYAVLCNIEKKNENVKLINFAKNFGQPAALLAGFKYATGDLVICGDDDGQTPFSNVIKMIDKLNEGFDVVCGKYTAREKQSFVRKMGTFCNTQMIKWFIGKPDDLYLSSFFVAKKFVVKELIKYTNPYPYIGGLLLRVTKNIGNLEVVQRERIAGKSGYNLKKLFSLWVNGFTAFSIKPLRFATLLGITNSIIGMLFGLFIVLRKLIYPNIALGWTSIIALLIFFGGLILFVLGIIGEYIGRIYICINNSPQYVIKETKNIEEEDNND